MCVCVATTRNLRCKRCWCFRFCCVPQQISCTLRFGVRVSSSLFSSATKKVVAEIRNDRRPSWSEAVWSDPLKVAVHCSRRSFGSESKTLSERYTYSISQRTRLKTNPITAAIRAIRDDHITKRQAKDGTRTLMQKERQAFFSFF